jgi:hypothetical protein
MLDQQLGRIRGRRVDRGCLVAALMVNGLFILRAEHRARSVPEAGWRWLRATAYVSLALWFLIMLAGTIISH